MATLVSTRLGVARLVITPTRNTKRRILRSNTRRFSLLSKRCSYPLQDRRRCMAI